MPAAETQQDDRFTIMCRSCDRAILASRQWEGREVRCPYCSTPLRVPKPPADDHPVRAAGPYLGARRGFYFPCPACGSLLEAHTGMVGHTGTCPTCAARMEIPDLKGRSGKPRKARLLEPGEDVAVPAHAYGADGLHAPQIVRLDTGDHMIICPRCGTYNAVETDACASCATPFTLDGAATVGGIRSERQASISLSLGLVALLFFPVVVFGLVAIVQGLRALMFAGPGKRRGGAGAGVALGAISLIGAAAFWYWKLKP